MIETRDLTVTYDGRAVLRAVDLTVPDGGHIALMGPSGCGKTTLLRVLAGLRAPDGGTVRVSPGRMACVFQGRGCCRGARRRKTSTPCSPTGRRPCRRRWRGSSGWS